MRSAAIFATLFLTTWIAATEAAFVAAALALGGLAALKGAALVGYAAGRHRRYHRGHYHGRSYGHYHGHGYGHGYGHGHGYRYGRSVESSPADEGEDLLLSAVGQLDPNGCVLKLLCQIQIKEEATRTLEESILVDMFANGTETLTAYNAAFVYASDVGSKTKDPAACKKYFPNCPLSDEELGGLFYQAWGCGFDFGGDESAPEEQPQELPQEILPVEEEEEGTPVPVPTEVSLLDMMGEKTSA